MTIIGGKFTPQKRNLVTYIEPKDYELLRRLAQLHGRSVSAEAALAILKYMADHRAELEKPPEKDSKSKSHG
jgi:hypothetical protein